MIEPSDGVCECPVSAASEPEPKQPHRSPAGSGYVELARVANATVVTRARSQSPLKLLIPRRSASSSAWIFASTYGGGLLAGDTIRLNARLHPGTTALLGTQASTKIYRSPDGVPSRQELNITAGAGATCVVAPHPVTCFARSRFVQRQRFDLCGDANLVLLDWLTSGRHATGERWKFDLYDSRTDVFVEGRRVFRDALRLSPEEGPIGSPHRTGGFDCLGYALVLGPSIGRESERILDVINRSAPGAGVGEPMLFSASPVGTGVVLRIAGQSAEKVALWVRKQLAFVATLLGEDPWKRIG